jgi:hypothetical protein
MALVFLPAACRAQEPAVSRGVLTNHDVVTLAEAGFSEEFLLEIIATSRPKFDITADGLADLAKHGVKEDVIRAMRGVHPVPEPAEAAGSGPLKPIRVFAEPDANSSFPSTAHPQTAEIVNAFGRKCPGIIVTSRKQAAAFTVVLEREPAKFLRRADSRMVVFDHAGDIVYGASGGSLAKAVRGFCSAAPKFLSTETVGRPQDALPGARWPQ